MDKSGMESIGKGRHNKHVKHEKVGCVNVIRMV